MTNNEKRGEEESTKFENSEDSFFHKLFPAHSDSFSLCVYIYFWTLFNKTFLFHWKYDTC